MSRSNPVDDFYQCKVYHCPCLRSFLKIIYSEECIHSVREIMNVLKNEEAFGRRTFFHRHFVIAFKIDFGHFLLTEQCNCEWVKGEGYRFGEESLGRRFCNSCMNKHSEIMSRDCIFRFFNESFFLF